MKDVTRPAIVDTAVLLLGSSGVVHQKSLQDDVPKGVMALDAERAQTTDAKPQPDSHAELLLGHGEAILN